MTKDSLKEIFKHMLEGLIEFNSFNTISRSDIADICYDLFEEFRY